MLPNLIVPGAGKSGTSSLHLYLDQHPDIVMSTTKEPHFFSDDNRYALGPKFYTDLFPPAVATARYRGESSTGYLLFPGVPERIRASVPDCRLIVLLRNPIDRAISHYRWLVGLGLESRDFRAAFDADRHEVPDPANSRAGNYGYIYQEGCYASHLERFYDLFPAEQILLLQAETLRAEPLAVLSRCWQFLALADVATVVEVSANESRTLRYPRVRARLEGRQSSAGSGRSRALVRTVLGKRLSSGLRRAAVATLGNRTVEVPINIDRHWLGEVYAAEVASLRARDSHFANAWREDFPA